MSKLHSTAHACSALCLGVCPGLKNLGLVMQRFYQDCLDKADPSTYFNRSGWTAAGAPADDMDAQRVCATEFARQADKALDERIRETSKKKSPATKQLASKREEQE